MTESSSGGFRVQQGEVVVGTNDDLLRSFLEPSDVQEPGECEVAALPIWRLQQNSLFVDFELTIASWSIGSSEIFDEGEMCGDVSDRTTLVAAFDSALARMDGTGVGNLILYRADYQAAGTRSEVDTAIRSSLASSMVVSSLGGNVHDAAPDTVFYGGPYFSAHVNFVAIDN